MANKSKDLGRATFFVPDAAAAVFPAVFFWRRLQAPISSRFDQERSRFARMRSSIPGRLTANFFSKA